MKTIEPTTRGLAYTGPMALAAREGVKTNTRRIVTSQPVLDSPKSDWWYWKGGPRLLKAGYGADYVHTRIDALVDAMVVACPYGVPGDRLYTREAWRTSAEYDDLPPRDVPDEAYIHYLADGESDLVIGKYRYARFMPKRIARDFYEITGVRVERVQEISEEDAKAEGIYSETIIRKGKSSTGRGDVRDYEYADVVYRWQKGERKHCGTARGAFANLWNSINGATPGCSWADNPWVWALAFKKTEEG